MNNEKIEYLADPREPGRVVTLVSRINNDTKEVSFAYAINTPSRWIKDVDKTRVTAYFVSGDRFVKRIGRDIARGRLNNEKTATTVSFSEGQDPRRAIFEAMAKNDNSVIRRLSKDMTALYRVLELMNQAQAKLPEAMTRGSDLTE